MAAAKPTPAFIARAVLGVEKAGHAPAGVEVRPDGTVVVLIVATVLPLLVPSTYPGEDSDECDQAFGGAS